MKKMNDGGPVDDKKDAPVVASTDTANGSDYGTLVGLREMLKKARGYDDGGVVDSDAPQDMGPVDDSQLPSAPDQPSKLQAVLQAMGLAANKAMGPLGPNGPLASAIAPMAASAAQSPAVPAIANAALGTNLPVPAPQSPTPAPAPQTAPSAPPAAPQPPQAVAPKPVTPPPTSATDIMSKLTDNDGAKMTALLAQLKDSDKRNQFAQALAVIGDTFGNMGQAKAGQHPDGITTPEMIQKLGEKNKASTLENMNQTIAANPQSQTSRMAQMTLMQSMGIKPNDPRAAQISKMPAMAITQMVPQMTDAVKNNIEKERNMIQAKQADLEASNQALARSTAATNAAREQQTANVTASNDVLKNNSPVNPFNGPMRDQARKTIEANMSGPGGGGNTQLPVVHTHADYNKLPRGARYQNAAGEMGVKS